MVTRRKYSFTKAPAPDPVGATWDHYDFNWTRYPSSLLLQAGDGDGCSLLNSCHPKPQEWLLGENHTLL